MKSQKVEKMRARVRSAISIPAAAIAAIATSNNELISCLNVFFFILFRLQFKLKYKLIYCEII